MRISDWSSDVCSSDLPLAATAGADPQEHLLRRRRRSVHLFVARRRGGEHPALRKGFSRRDGDPPRTELSLDAPDPRRRLGADRAEQRPARQDAVDRARRGRRSEEHTSELQSLMRISYAVFCLKKKKEEKERETEK